MHPSFRAGKQAQTVVVVDAAGDEVAIRSALERYEDIDMNFAGSREAKLLKVRTPLHTGHVLTARSVAPRLRLA